MFPVHIAVHDEGSDGPWVFEPAVHMAAELLMSMDREFTRAECFEKRSNSINIDTIIRAQKDPLRELRINIHLGQKFTNPFFVSVVTSYGGSS